MLDKLIRTSLDNRVMVAAISLLLVCLGSWQVWRMPIDVFPDLNRPRVVIMTEASGLAPEEVESLVTFPIETSVNGASGVESVRSSSSVGISIVYVEFAYGTNIYTNRQIVNERLQLIEERLPVGVKPQLAPISSIMGQILMLGMWSDDPSYDPMELRTQADWVVRQRLLTIPGVAQVFTMGGERRQYQVLIDPDALVRYGVTLEEVERAVQSSNANGTGGYLDQQGPKELLVRSIGRIQSIDELKTVAVTLRDGRPVLLGQVADVREGAQIKRGDGSAMIRNMTSNSDDFNSFTGGPAVVLTINKQPGADTRKVTDNVLRVINELRASLPASLHIVPTYSQKSFIDRAIENVEEALRDGVILIVIVLFLFLMNVRTTLITLTAIPLSLFLTALVFAATGLSINTMTLGGIAVAMGELVDDAIVDVENILRRLKENRMLAQPLHPLTVVYRASSEVRRSIVFSTAVVILVFLPLFALEGMEGKLFTPLGIAYIVSILASLLVSLTVTPVLSYWLLAGIACQESGRDGVVLRGVKWIGERVIRFSLRFPRTILVVVLCMVAIAGVRLLRLEKDFLPPFNEGTVQLNVILPPGVSLATSSEVNLSVERSLQNIPFVRSFVRRTGRAELDEHAEGVNMSEYLIELNHDSAKSRSEQLEEIRNAMNDIPGIITSTEQPIAHLISHMLSGVKAAVGIKLYGDDLSILRQKAEAIEAAMRGVPGVADPMVEPQVSIPQLRIEMNRERLAQEGLSVQALNDYIQTAMNGQVASEVLEDMRTFDLVVRMKTEYREDIDRINRLPIPLPSGGSLPLSHFAAIYEAEGPNVVNRENVRRRIIVQCNVQGRGVVDVVQDIQTKLEPVVSSLPRGYYLTYEGQFQSQQSASRMMAVLFAVSMTCVFLTLYTLFGSSNLALQVMAALPMAFIGSVAALELTDQTLTIAAMVGFISLSGIASRNGVLLLQHYMHLVEYEEEAFDHKMIVRAGVERLAPVLMTALTAGTALIPLVLAAGEPGKEILYPVATVILGGIISSTMLDFFVHPALFWIFGTKSAARALRKRSERLELSSTNANA